MYFKEKEQVTDPLLYVLVCSEGGELNMTEEEG